MTEKNIVVLTAPGRSGAYETINKLQSAPGFVLDASALVERAEDGTVSLADGSDDEGGEATLGGSAIGMIVGMLGGPLGMLLGLGAGALAGAAVDADRLDVSEGIIADFADLVPPGGNAVIAQVTEDGPAALDAFAASVGARLSRRPLEEVVSEVEAQQEAAEAAARAARQAVREQKKQERHEKWEERVEKLKAKFRHDS